MHVQGHHSFCWKIRHNSTEYISRCLLLLYRNFAYHNFLHPHWIVCLFSNDPFLFRSYLYHYIFSENIGLTIPLYQDGKLDRWVVNLEKIPLLLLLAEHLFMFYIWDRVTEIQIFSAQHFTVFLFLMPLFLQNLT